MGHRGIDIVLFLQTGSRYRTIKNRIVDLTAAFISYHAPVIKYVTGFSYHLICPGGANRL